MDVECDGGAGAGGAVGGNNLGLSRSADGASSCAQNGPTSPACATSDGGNGNGGTGAPGGIGGDSIGGDGGIGGDVFGGTGADGASACETRIVTFNNNGSVVNKQNSNSRKEIRNELPFFFLIFMRL